MVYRDLPLDQAEQRFTELRVIEVPEQPMPEPPLKQPRRRQLVKALPPKSK